MSEENKKESNLPNWIDDHLKTYLETDGEEGYMFRGVSSLILTTTGRKTDKERTNPVIFQMDGDDYIIVGSRGGDVRHPGWYLNLVENPNVKVQVKADKFEATARIATAEERPRLWDKMVAVYPDFTKYQANTDREIQIVILERK